LKTISRKSAIQHLALGLFAFPHLCRNFGNSDNAKKFLKPYPSQTWKGNIHHSVCYWMYSDVPLEDFCNALKKIGIHTVDLIGPNDWDTLKKLGMNCGIANGAEISLNEGFNHVENHEKLIQKYTDIIPKLASYGFDNLICFSGQRKGISDAEGLENCAKGLKALMPIAEKYKVTLSMELLNSKVNHPDYQCDHSAWGVELCKKVGSPNFKLLYDIYHMQIMEGNIIDTIQKNSAYFSHYHTAGVPGRHDIDDDQELNYPAIMEAIVKTGFKGSVAQEFNPKITYDMGSLVTAFKTCDV